jgi:hypothetical protein
MVGGMCKISDSPVGITVFSLQEFFRPKSFWFFGNFSGWFSFVSVWQRRARIE